MTWNLYLAMLVVITSLINTIFCVYVGDIVIIGISVIALVLSIIWLVFVINIEVVE